MELSDMVSDRPRGVLSESDRKFLSKPAEEREEEYSSSARSQRRSAIRERVSNAILDYPLLADELEDDQLENIVGDIFDREESTTQLIDSLKAQTRFVYRVARAATLDGEKVIEEGVNEAKESRIDILKRRFENDPQALTLGELSDLYEAGEISENEYSELFRDALAPPSPGATSLEELREFFGEHGEIDDTDEE